MVRTVTLQATPAGDIRTETWRALQSPGTICFEPGNPMPVGTYGVMKTTLERMEADAQSMLGLRYTMGIALRKMARWMLFALEWVGYYQKKKRHQYHQETKGTVWHIFRSWYRKGPSSLRYINTQRALAPQPVWEEWEEQAHVIW